MAPMASSFNTAFNAADDPFSMTNSPPSMGSKDFLNACINSAQGYRTRSLSPDYGRYTTRTDIFSDYLADRRAARSKDDTELYALEGSGPAANVGRYHQITCSIDDGSSPTLAASMTTTDSGTIFVADHPQLDAAVRECENVILLPRFNDNHEVTIKNAFRGAQQTFPHTAALFVGNLPASYTDYQLAVTVGGTFGAFGRCYVRVQRAYTSRHVKPTAIVQFTNDTDAAAALAGSTHRSLTIGERPLRVERSTPRVARISALPGFVFAPLVVVGALAAVAPVRRWWLDCVVNVEFATHGGYRRVRAAIKAGHLTGLNLVE